MTRARRRIIRYLIYAVIILLAVSLLNFWQAVRPPRISVDRSPSDFNLPDPEEVTLVARDGVQLSSWYFPASEAESVIIWLHGYPAEKTDMLFLAAELWPDHSLFLKDFRYFGDSEGRATTLGLKEPGDISRAVDWVAEKNYSEIALAGFSYGGAQAILAAGSDDRIKAVASYSSYSDLRQLGQEVVPFSPILGPPIVSLMELWARIIWQDIPTRTTPASIITELDIPIWLAHDRKDDVIDFSHAKQLAEAGAQNPNLETFFFSHGPHGALPLSDFNRELAEFFNQAW